MKRALLMLTLMGVCVSGCADDKTEPPRFEQLERLEETVSLLEAKILELESTVLKHEANLKRLVGEDISWLESTFWKRTGASNERRPAFSDYLSFSGGRVITFDREGARKELGVIRYPVTVIDGSYIITLADDDGDASGIVRLAQQKDNTLEVSLLRSRKGSVLGHAVFEAVETK